MSLLAATHVASANCVGAIVTAYDKMGIRGAAHDVLFRHPDASRSARRLDVRDVAARGEVFWCGCRGPRQRDGDKSNEAGRERGSNIQGDKTVTYAHGNLLAIALRQLCRAKDVRISTPGPQAL
jgi:hypothetical protein